MTPEQFVKGDFYFISGHLVIFLLFFATLPLALFFAEMLWTDTSDAETKKCISVEIEKIICTKPLGFRCHEYETMSATKCI